MHSTRSHSLTRFACALLATWRRRAFCSVTAHSLPNDATHASSSALSRAAPRSWSANAGLAGASGSGTPRAGAAGGMEAGEEGGRGDRATVAWTGADGGGGMCRLSELSSSSRAWSSCAAARACCLD